jgi:hypothetical protein
VRADCRPFLRDCCARRVTPVWLCRLISRRDERRCSVPFVLPLSKSRDCSIPPLSPSGGDSFERFTQKRKRGGRRDRGLAIEEAAAAISNPSALRSVIGQEERNAAVAWQLRRLPDEDHSRALRLPREHSDVNR